MSPSAECYKVAIEEFLRGTELKGQGGTSPWTFRAHFEVALRRGAYLEATERMRLEEGRKSIYDQETTGVDAKPAAR
jgi:hypothetical protein